MYWDLYHNETDRLVKEYPKNVIKYKVSVLLAHMSHAAQREMLSFIGIRQPRVKHMWHSNAHHEHSSQDTAYRKKRKHI